MDLHENLFTLSLDEQPVIDRCVVAGIVSVCTVGEGNWRIFGECLTSLAKHCTVVAIITTAEEHDEIVDFLENGEGGGVNKPKLGPCRLEMAIRKFFGNQDRASVFDSLRSDMVQARALTATDFVVRKEKKTMLASHCICIRVDMLRQTTQKGMVAVVEAAKDLQKKMQQQEGGPDWLKPNQLICFPLKLSTGKFQPPPQQKHTAFDESRYDLPPKPIVRLLMPLPRPSDYLPFAFRPQEDNLPTTIFDLPTGTGQLCRIKPPVWKEPTLGDSEKVMVPAFVYTNMQEKRRDTPCLSMPPLNRGSATDLEIVKEFQTDERHKAYHLPQYHQPQLLVFEPLRMPVVTDESLRWWPSREIEHVDRLVLQKDLGAHPVFVLDAAGSMAGSKWQSLLAHMLDLFSSQGRIQCLTESFDIVVTLNNNTYTYSGGVGHRRHLSPSSEFACECARSWLLQWTPGGNADMLGALSSALDCQLASEIHVISDKHPERSNSILELVGKKCKPNHTLSHAADIAADCKYQGISLDESSGGFHKNRVTFQPTGDAHRIGRHVNCIAFEGTCTSRRFFRRLAHMSGGVYREYVLHFAACPLHQVHVPLTGKNIKGGNDDDLLLENAKKFWQKVKEALAHKGIIAWMLNVDKYATGVVSTEDVVHAIKLLLDSFGMRSDVMADFLSEDGFGLEDNVDIRDLVRSIVIDGYTKITLNQQQPPVRFYSLGAKTRELMIEHARDTEQYLHEADDGGGEEAFCLLPRDLVKGLDALNTELKLCIPETELLKISFLVTPNDEGRIDCKDLISFFAKQPAKRGKRVEKQNAERKQMSHQMKDKQCECFKSTQHSDDALVHFLTTAELHERMQHIHYAKQIFLTHTRAIEEQINAENRRRQYENDEANRNTLLDAKHDHERRLQEYNDVLDAQISADRDKFFERWSAAPTARNASRILKNAYDICVFNLREGDKPGDPPPFTLAELDDLFCDATTLRAERLQNEALAAREKERGDALKKMGGTRAVPNILEYNIHVLQTTVKGHAGVGRQGLLHDVRECPICQHAAPMRVEMEINEGEWHMLDVKMMIPHFREDMIIPEIVDSVRNTLAKVFLQGDFFVLGADIDVYKLTNTKPGVLEAHKGMKVKLQMQLHIYVHAGIEKCRKGLERLDTFLQTGEFNNQLQFHGFPMKLLKKCKVEFEHPKVMHRPADLAQVAKAKILLAEHESAWNDDYVRALEAEDARQLEADEERLAMHVHLCKAAERENYRRLIKKKELLRKVHKQEQRDVNEKNMARLKRYQTLLKKENESLNEEEREKHEAKKVEAERRFNREFDLAQENNKMAKTGEEELKEYTANLMKTKSSLAMAKREALKVWQEEDRVHNVQYQGILQAARDEFNKIDVVWVKKFGEASNFTKKVHAELYTYVDGLHERLEKKAYGKHVHTYGSQEKVNTMLIEASEAFHAKNVRDIENSNHEQEKMYRKMCSKVAIVNRDREKEVTTHMHGYMNVFVHVRLYDCGIWCLCDFYTCTYTCMCPRTPTLEQMHTHIQIMHANQTCSQVHAYTRPHMHTGVAHQIGSKRSQLSRDRPGASATRIANRNVHHDERGYLQGLELRVVAPDRGDET